MIMRHIHSPKIQLQACNKCCKRTDINWICSLYLHLFQEILEGVTNIDLVINLKLREEALLAKCLGRRTCSQCGGNYNVACIDFKADDKNPAMYMPPLLPPEECASKLITRSDDTEQVVKERLRIYNEKVCFTFVIICQNIVWF